MVPINVTGSAVLDTLREVVAERPDYVYSAPEDQVTESLSCYYVHGSGSDATPGCVVGHVLNRLGVPLEVLSTYEGRDADYVAARVLDVSDDWAADAPHALAVAQIEQDRGAAWGKALARALGN